MSNLTKWRLFVHHFVPCHKKAFLFQENFQPNPNEPDSNPNKNSAGTFKNRSCFADIRRGKSLRMKRKLVEISEMDKKARF